LSEVLLFVATGG